MMIIYSSKIKLRAVARQEIVLVDFLMSSRNFISRVYCLASPMSRLLRERSGESGYTPRKFSELKSGGDNSYAVPQR